MFNLPFILGIAIAFAVAMYGSYTKGGKDANAEYLAKTVKAEQDARKEEKRRADAQKEADDKHFKDLAKARSDADASNDALSRLRKRLAPGSSPAISGTPLIGPATGKVNELLGTCAAEYRNMAEDADTARLAGLQCERYYDSNIADKVKAHLGKLP